jgi:hypothetical protein
VKALALDGVRFGAGGRTDPVVHLHHVQKDSLRNVHYPPNSRNPVTRF